MQKPQGCYAFQTCLLLVVLRDYCSGVLEKVVYIIDQQSPSRSVMSGEQITEALFFSPQLSMFFGSIDSVELVIFFVCVCVCAGYPLLCFINHKFEPTKFNLSVLVIRVCIFGQDFFKTSILIFTTGHLHRGVNTCFRQLAIIRRSIISYQ